MSKLMSKKRKETTILVKKDIVIPAGTILQRGPVRTDFGVPHYEKIIGFGPDGTGTFYVDEGTIELNPDTFEVQ